MKVIILSLLLGFLAVFAYAQDRHYTTTDAEAIKHFALANQALDENEYDAAVAELQKAVQEDSKFVEADLQLADLYSLLRQYKPAIEQYRAAIALNPDFSQAVYHKLGAIEIRDGQY